MEPKMTVVDASAFFGQTTQAITKRMKKLGIVSKKISNKSYFGHNESRVLFEDEILSHFKKNNKKLFSFVIVKGGTGKTTTAVSVAARASLYGFKVLVVDMDQQGNSTRAFDIDPNGTPVMIDVLKDPNIGIRDAIISAAPGIDLIPSRMDNAVLDNVIMMERHSIDKVYKRQFKDVRKEYDFIFFDCPPNLGSSVSATISCSDGIIAPLMPDDFAVAGLKITYNELQSLQDKLGVKVPFKVLFNKFDSRTSLSNEVLMWLYSSKIYKKLAYKKYIRQAQDFPNTIRSKISIYDSVKGSTAKEDVDCWFREFLGELSKDFKLGEQEREGLRKAKKAKKGEFESA